MVGKGETWPVAASGERPLRGNGNPSVLDCIVALSAYSYASGNPRPGSLARN